MNHYPAFLRPHLGKSTNQPPAPSNNENDENSSIKARLLKHLTKTQQGSSNSNHGKGAVRGALGEVGNKPVLTESKAAQQPIVETKPALVVPPPASILPMVINKIDAMTLDENDEMDESILAEPIAKLTQVPSKFDCDSADRCNTTTVAEYVVDICIYLRELEQQTPIRQNFLLNRNEGKETSCERLRSYRLCVFRYSITAESSCTDRLALSST